jgi:hypothetical protein
LQNESIGRSSEGILFGFGIERLASEFDTGSGSFNARAVLLQGELRVANVDADLIFLLLQTHLRLTVLEQSSNLIRLSGAIAKRDVQLKANTLVGGG